MSRLLIAGYFGFGNCGDEAILSAMIQDLRAEIPSAHFTILSGDPERTSDEHRVQAVAWSDNKAIAGAIQASDLIILGGGGLFHDYWGVDTSTLLTPRQIGMGFYTTVAYLASIYSKPLMLYAVGIGPLSSASGRRAMFAIAQAANLVCVRDAVSRDQLIGLGASPEHIQISADAAFSFRASRNEPSGEETLLGVALRNWDVGVSPDDWCGEVAKSIDMFLEVHPNRRALFIPFQDSAEKLLDDNSLAKRISHLLHNRTQSSIMTGATTLSAISGKLGTCDLILGMRLHALILAANFGLPMVALSYDSKVSAIMNQFGLEDYSLEIDAISSEPLADRLEKAFQNKACIADQLARTLPDLASRARSNAIIARRILENSEQFLSPDLAPLVNFVTTSISESLEAIHKKNEGLLAAEQRSIGRIAALQDQINVHLQKIEDQRREIEDFRGSKGVQRLRSQIAETYRPQLEELAAIKSSRGWKIIWCLWRIRLFFLPRDSRRERFLSGVATTFLTPLRFFRHKLRNFSIWQSRYAFVFDLFKRERDHQTNPDLSSLRLPSKLGLVSIVLPVHNGEKFIQQAIDSILAQTYEEFELIIVDDGSTDGTPAILDACASKDERIRVIRQSNLKLPAALNIGFKVAHGEYLTWTSDDNLLKPRFIEQMVAEMERRPQIDMLFANMDIIGEDDSPLRKSAWFAGYQWPPGKEHIYLPQDTAELNTYPNNFIGGAFMYRDRVQWLIGGYSPLRYTREDYDYWMRVNALLALRHSKHVEPLYQYRFHDASLTERDFELGITRDRVLLMVFDDFRRDFYLMPLLFQIEADIDQPPEILHVFHDWISRSGYILDEENNEELPRLWSPYVLMRITSDPDAQPPKQGELPPGAIAVLFLINYDELPESVSRGWDLCLALGPDRSVPDLGLQRGWCVSPDMDSLFTAIDIRVRSQGLRRIEDEISRNGPSSLKVSVIICTHKPNSTLEDAILSAAHQTIAQSDYEVLVIDNSPDGNLDRSLMERIRSETFKTKPEQLRLIRAPIPGLSHARNAGIAEARGELLLFLDDDVVASEDILERYIEAFSDHPEAGVIGGEILLTIPEILEIPWKDGWESYWSHFETAYETYAHVVDWWDFPWGANWCARRSALLKVGGFRSGYGRCGDDFGGGEEIIAANLIQELGYQIAILPDAKVEHHVNPNRFTLEHLKQTIRAGIFVRYQAQRELRVPRSARPRGVVRSICNAFSALGSWMLDSSDPVRRAQYFELRYYSQARLQLLGLQIKDALRRFRRTVTRRN